MDRQTKSLGKSLSSPSCLSSGILQRRQQEARVEPDFQPFPLGPIPIFL